MEDNKTMDKDKVEETKKLDDLKNTEENKEAVAKAEGKVVEEKKEAPERQSVPLEGKSKPAVAKVKTSKDKKKDAKVELEREYIVPMRKGFLNVPHYRRAKKAVKTLKEFMVRHMNIRDGDTRKVKVDIHLNNEIWFRGIKKPLNKIKVKAKKVGDIVTVSLADPADYVKFKMAREEKAKKAAEAGKKKPKAEKKEKSDDDKDKDGVSDKKEEKEDAKSEAEKDAKTAKVETKVGQHTVKGEHKQKIASTKGLK